MLRYLDPGARLRRKYPYRPLIPITLSDAPKFHIHTHVHSHTPAPFPSFHAPTPKEKADDPDSTLYTLTRPHLRHNRHRPPCHRIPPLHIDLEIHHNLTILLDSILCPRRPYQHNIPRHNHILHLEAPKAHHLLDHRTTAEDPRHNLCIDDRAERQIDFTQVWVRLLGREDGGERFV